MIFRKEQYIILGVKLGCLKARCAAIFFSKCMATNDWFGKMTKPKSYFLILYICVPRQGKGRY